MKTTVHCGSFESERYWREKDLAALPSIPDLSGMSIVQAMDEMLFVFCGSGDVLLTRYGMNKAQVDYLHSLGYAFTTNVYPMTLQEEGAAQESLNIFELLDRLDPEGPLARMIPGERRFLLCRASRNTECPKALPPSARTAGRADGTQREHQILLDCDAGPIVVAERRVNG